jgi:hypothetical protein
MRGNGFSPGSGFLPEEDSAAICPNPYYVIGVNVIG